MLKVDLKSLCQWSEDWQMLLNVDKREVMHFGANSSKETDSISNTVLKEVEDEKDLGVIVQNNLKVSEQCSKVVQTANRVLGMISRTSQNKSKEIIIPLYKSLVRPHLEYCVQVWRLHLIKDIQLIENVQHRATRMIYELHGQTYNQRLIGVKLT